MAPFGPNYLSAGAANAPEWAHCISGSCCQWLCLGPFFFWEALQMYLDGPIKLTAAASNGLSWTQLFLGRWFCSRGVGPCYYSLLTLIPLLRPHYVSIR